MGLTIPAMESFTYDASVANDHRPNHGIGMHPTAAFFSQTECAAHPFFVDRHLSIIC